MRVVVALAAIPVVIWAATPRSAPPIEVKAVTPEGVTEARADATSFRLRWSLVSDLPPMKEIIHEPLLLVSHEPAPMAQAGATVSPALRKQAVALRADVCARHGKRKVLVRGGRSWRCR